ncbi:hypothetical protein PbDSM24746_01590 [Paenibacillus macerans]|nr:hypothetical protein PbDSM24746_01590 [Paenibacillus macerans]GBK66451.1 hypothetical protein PbJCM17693_01590 [Paenibacillus macerans]GIP09758.1 hypothetical protein J1TS5_19280 [Paenibacillus macerans]
MIYRNATVEDISAIVDANEQKISDIDNFYKPYQSQIIRCPYQKAWS